MGGPLGPEGYLAVLQFGPGRTAGGNQGCLFEEPVPVGAVTNTSPGEIFSRPTELGGGVLGIADAGWWWQSSSIFFTGINRNNRSPDRQSGAIVEAINWTDYANQSAEYGGCLFALSCGLPAQREGHEQCDDGLLHWRPGPVRRRRPTRLGRTLLWCGTKEPARSPGTPTAFWWRRPMAGGLSKRTFTSARFCGFSGLRVYQSSCSCGYGRRDSSV